MSKFTDFYIKAETEQQALQAANVEGYDLVMEDEDGNLYWNTSPANGAGAFAVTRGPIAGYEDVTIDDETTQVPIYADGFYGLLRVRTAVADEVQAMLTGSGVEQLELTESPSRFS